VNSRIFVIENLVKYRAVRVYDLARNAPFVISTIYYTLGKLEDEGVVERRGEYYITNFQGCS